MLSRWRWLALLLIGSKTVVGADLSGVHRSAITIPDAPYLQEAGWTMPSEVALSAVVAYRGEVLVGTARGVIALKDRHWAPDTGMTQSVQRLVVARDQVWAIGVPGLWVREAGLWRQISTSPVSDIQEFRGKVLASVGSRLLRVQGHALESFSEAKARFEIQRLVSHQDLIYVVGSGRISPYSRGRFGGEDAYTWPSDLG